MLDFCVNFALWVGKIIGGLLTIDIVMAMFLFAPMRLIGILPEYAAWEAFGWVLAGVGYGALTVGLLVVIYRRSGGQ